MRPKQLHAQQRTKIKDITEKDVQWKKGSYCPVDQFQPFSVYTYVLKPIEIFR